ncbi:MAG: helix-turn-helix transcriptional regulator [Candidatus Saccharibacteria bacterium]|nr:helix-turn-helix transcriptional regulator [Microbacteriaceae bacterium]
MLINDLVELGELIRRRRTDHGLSQNELAEQTGTTRQWVSRLEKGKNDIGTARLLAVLAVLELNLDIRPPRLVGAKKVVNEGDREQSLIPSETVRALARMRDETMGIRREAGSLLPATYLPGRSAGLGSVLSALTASDELNVLEAGRRRILEASLKFSQRRADSNTNTNTETEPDDAQP